MKSCASLLIAATISFTSVLQAAPPKGWWSAPSEDYRIGVDTAEPGKPAAFIESTVPEPKQFIALNQTFSARDYLGKRVRLKGEIKTQGVKKWAGFWLRADGAKGNIVAFDNMQRRGLSGNTDWTSAEIVLDVPSEADKIFFGLILDGEGKVWMRGLTFEVVGDAVAVTAPKMKELPSAPTNLNFTEQ